MAEGAVVVERKRRYVAVPLGERDVEFLAVVEEVPPKWVPENKGKSKYPFDQIVIGGGMKVRRSIETVRSALRGWLKHHKAYRFQAWKGRDKDGAYVMVKRLK